jgi:hypothetical protein
MLIGLRMPSQDSNHQRSPIWLWGAFLLVILVATSLRGPELGNVPPGLWFDEALDGQDAAAVWAPGGHFRLVYPDVFPRETIYTSLLAIAIKFGGPEVVTLRMVSVIIGILTVALLFGLLRCELGPGPALAAAGVLATLRWHVIFSRLVFRTILLGPWLIALLWAALALRRRPNATQAIVLGLLVGGGFYTYLTWYFMLPWVAGILLWLAWLARQGVLPWRHLALTCLAAALAFAPLGVHYLRVPQDLLARPQAVSPFAKGVGAGLREITKNTRDCLLMFHVRGDHVPKHNIPLPGGKYGRPALDGIQGLFFLAGLIVCVQVLRRRLPGSRALAVLLPAWVGCALLATIFTQTDSPNTLRTLCAAPAVAALTGWGLFSTIQWLGRRASPALRIAVVALIIACSGAITARAVYYDWPQRIDVWQSFNGDIADLANFAREAPTETVVYVPQYLYEHRSFQFLLLGRPDTARRILPYHDFSFLKPWIGLGPAPKVRWVLATAHNQAYTAIDRLVPNAQAIHPFNTPYDPAVGAPRTWALALAIHENELPPLPAIRALENSWRTDLKF